MRIELLICAVVTLFVVGCTALHTEQVGLNMLARNAKIYTTDYETMIIIDSEQHQSTAWTESVKSTFTFLKDLVSPFIPPALSPNQAPQ
jgi:hypothetical protein